MNSSAIGLDNDIGFCPWCVRFYLDLKLFLHPLLATKLILIEDSFASSLYRSKHLSESVLYVILISFWRHNLAQNTSSSSISGNTMEEVPVGLLFNKFLDLEEIDNCKIEELFFPLVNKISFIVIG